MDYMYTLQEKIKCNKTNIEAELEELANIRRT